MAEQIIGLITYCLFWVTFLFIPFIESKTGKETILLSHSSDMVDFTQNYLNVKGVLKMAENLRYKSVIIRKPHVCFGCGRSFDPPTRMTSAAYADGGTVDSYYLCETCTAIASEMGFDDEFGFGDLRDEALEREQNG